MYIQAVKTRLVKAGDSLEEVITESISSLKEKTVLTIASKIFATAEDRFVPKASDNKDDKSEKHELVKKEAEWYVAETLSKYNLMLTIKGLVLFVNAGIDESNADNQYLLWPENPQASVNALWQSLRAHYKVEHLGVIMTDSISRPLTLGVTGCAVVSCGFEPLKSYIGKPDLFGRSMQMEQVNVATSLAAAGTYVTGEGDEQTPVAIIEEIPDIIFLDRPPTTVELAKLKISLEDDVYAPLLTSVQWRRGGGQSR